MRHLPMKHLYGGRRTTALVASVRTYVRTSTYLLAELEASHALRHVQHQLHQRLDGVHVTCRRLARN